MGDGIRRPAIIVDMDGTLVDVAPIRHHILENGDYDSFHLESYDCEEHKSIADSVRSWCQTDVAIIIVTARSDRYADVSIDWLNDHNIEFDAMFMRNEGDRRGDVEVKSEMLKGIRSLGFNPLLAYEDNPHIIQLWHDNNIPTVKGPGWM